MRFIIFIVHMANRPLVDEFAVFGMPNFRGISTTRVLCILSLVTRPISSRLGIASSHG
jgi:hypothetical protein